jgi:small GTP-binding protein
MIKGVSIYRPFKLDTANVTGNASFNGRCLSSLQSIIAQAKSIANRSSDEGKVAPSNTNSIARPKLNTNKAAIDNNININDPKLDGVNNSGSLRTSLSFLMKDAFVDKLGQNSNGIQSGVQKFSSSVHSSSDSSQSTYASNINTGRKASFSSIMESYRDEDSARRNSSMRSATLLSASSKASWLNISAAAAEVFTKEGLSMRTSFMNASEQMKSTNSDLKRPSNYSKNATTPHSKKVEAAASYSPRREGESAADNEGDIPIEIYDHRYSQQRQKIAHKREEFSQKYGPSLSASKKPMGASSADVHVDMPDLKCRTIESLRFQHRDSDKSASSSSSSSIPAAMNKPKGPATIVTEVIIPGSGLTIRDLSSKLSLRLPDLLKKLVEVGELPETALRKDRSSSSISSSNSESDNTKLEDKLIDADTAELIVLEMGFIAKRVEDKNQARVATITDRPSMHASHHPASELQVRSPVVCVMGHVDHGKTTLLDSLRHLDFNLDRAVTDGATVKKNKKQQIVAAAVDDDDDAEQDNDKQSSLVKATDAVAGTEAGGITQKLSAFSVDMVGNRRVVFLDTPGHAAFSTMRSHGAVATDIVVLVVAIDDGVRPQTLEALKMAQDTNSSIIIALNKIDKIPYEDRSKARTKVLTQLMSHNLIAEEFGGEVQVLEVAGRTGEGLKELVDGILMQADLLELQSSFKGQAEAIVLDASVSKGRGVEAEVLLKWGELSVGDPIVVGSSYGKVKMMVNAKGQSLRTAYPSDSVRLLGLRSLPMTGQEMLSVASDNIAREIAERRQHDYEARRYVMLILLLLL